MRFPLIRKYTRSDQEARTNPLVSAEIGTFERIKSQAGKPRFRLVSRDSSRERAEFFS